MAFVALDPEELPEAPDEPLPLLEEVESDAPDFSDFVDFSGLFAAPSRSERLSVR